MTGVAVRSGFSLVELIIGLLVLSVVVLGLGGATARLSTQTARAAAAVAAVNHAESRLDRIRTEPAYDSLEARFVGVESDLIGIPSSTRETRIVHVVDTLDGGRVLDFKRITVTVDAPMLLAPVARTATVAAP